jgi:hypothetical protein
VRSRGGPGNFGPATELRPAARVLSAFSAVTGTTILGGSSPSPRRSGRWPIVLHEQSSARRSSSVESRSTGRRRCTRFVASSVSSAARPARRPARFSSRSSSSRRATTSGERTYGVSHERLLRRSEVGDRTEAGRLRSGQVPGGASPSAGSGTAAAGGLVRPGRPRRAADDQMDARHPRRQRRGPSRSRIGAAYSRLGRAERHFERRAGTRARPQSEPRADRGDARTDVP